MGIRQTWRDYRLVKRELSPRKLVPTVVRDVRAGRLTVGEVARATASVWLDLGDTPRRHNPADEGRDKLRNS